MRRADAPGRAIDKQALVTVGARAIPPTGTAPGVAVPAADGRPRGARPAGPPHELQAMWPTDASAPTPSSRRSAAV
ncbi:hypothetical protein [Gordonia spumicola]|uniref:hypothetical protein n=1 Tax=Gordonia spumicola TaxID=589161 RepID=UPI0027E568D7|nr:hypothetical protein [Gordonia spumicola]